MGNGRELKSEGAQALRAAGFKPLPRLWVKQEDLDIIEYMASKHSAEVSRIRAEALERKKQRLERERQIDLAWAKMASDRSSTDEE